MSVPYPLNPGTFFFFYRTCAKLLLNLCPAALAPSRARFAEAPLVVSPICSFLRSCSEGNTPGVCRGGSKAIRGSLLLGKNTLGDEGVVVVLSCKVTANTDWWTLNHAPTGNTRLGSCKLLITTFFLSWSILNLLLCEFPFKDTLFTIYCWFIDIELWPITL